MKPSFRFLPTAQASLLAASLLASHAEDAGSVPAAKPEGGVAHPVTAPVAPAAREFPSEPAPPSATPATKVVQAPAVAAKPPVAAAPITAAKTTSAPAATDANAPSQASIGAKVGSGTQEFSTGLLYPAVSSGPNLLGLALRGTLVDDEEQEAGIGVVFRHLDEARGCIYGLNLFHDTRWTAEDNTFGILGAGVEWLSQRADLRANWHHPLDDAEPLTETRRTDVATAGGQRVTTTTLLRSHEEALEGFDVEAGLWLPGLPPSMPTAVYAGYYDLTSDYSGDYSGVNLRVESHLTPRFSIDLQWMDDEDVAGSEYFVGARFVFPFGGTPSAEGGERGLSSRMSEMVRQDFHPRPVVGDPVPVGTEVSRVNIRKSASPAPVRIRLPATPNCYLDGDGNVICN